MARLHAVPPHEFDPALRTTLGPAIDDPQGLGLLRVLAQRPDVTDAFLAFRSAMAATSTLPPRLVELTRLRIAFHNQCRSCMALRTATGAADGVTEALVCSLEKPDEAPDLTDAEKAALRYADLFATDHLAAGEAVFDDLRLHFAEPEIVELGMQIAVFVGFGRLSATWDIVDDLPERFHARDVEVTPWGSDAVVADHR
ncbi:carboxymuconolactone decarboxylase family protein [Pseudonocardia sp. N23]|uniref:carboxymuconolactone decarboxylase family protein n=1 Tax=Pseudonocardia sp. N23 TaxID=1987376 RepID=UPI000BFBF2CD|nr:carboxymuconolactone decarboxylase family protein [Pseudonocardia sp. N23]GAY09101.1 DitP protein [Pseudonocardia sp. N23]